MLCRVSSFNRLTSGHNWSIHDISNEWVGLGARFYVSLLDPRELASIGRPIIRLKIFGLPRRKNSGVADEPLMACGHPGGGKRREELTFTRV
jgi:hypothetical protein